MEEGRKRIQITKRTQSEIESYLQGFNAGVEMCINAINDNYTRYKKMVQGVVIDMMESEEKQCSECIYFEVNSLFSTDFCLKHEESANSYDNACEDFKGSEEA